MHSLQTLIIRIAILMNRMKTAFSLLAVAFLTLLSVPTVHGAAVVSLQNLSIAEGTATVDMIVSVSSISGDQITGFQSAIIQVGDGGALLGGTDTSPPITSVDFANSILVNPITAPSGVDPVTGFGDPSTTPSGTSLIIDPGKVLLDPANDFVVASGELFRFSIDTSSLIAGQVVFLTMDTSSTLGPTFSGPGSITVQASAVPEPGFALPLLVCIGFVVVGRRRKKCVADNFSICLS